MHSQALERPRLIDLEDFYREDPRWMHPDLEVGRFFDVDRRHRSWFVRWLESSGEVALVRLAAFEDPEGFAYSGELGVDLFFEILQTLFNRRRRRQRPSAGAVLALVVTKEQLIAAADGAEDLGDLGDRLGIDLSGLG